MKFTGKCPFRHWLAQHWPSAHTAIERSGESPLDHARTLSRLLGLPFDGTEDPRDGIPRLKRVLRERRAAGLLREVG
jgi:hypothetical protein